MSGPSATSRRTVALATGTLLVVSLAHAQPAGLPDSQAATAYVEGLVADRLAQLTDRLRSGGADDFPAGVPFLVRFAGDLGGLAVGAPVQAQGARIGTVRAAEAAFSTTGALDVAVLIDLVPERIRLDGRRLATADDVLGAARALVARGLRARLAGGDPLSGDRRVVLELVAEAAPATLREGGEHPELPTAAASVGELRATLDTLVARLQALPIERLFGEAEAAVLAVRDLASGPELRTTLDNIVATSREIRTLATGPEVRGALGDITATSADLRALVTGPEVREALANLVAASNEVRALAGRLDTRVEPVVAGLERAAGAAEQGAVRAGRLVAGLDTTVGPRAPLWANVEGLMRELTGTVRALRLLVEYLERRPDALIRGRSGGQP